MRSTECRMRKRLGHVRLVNDDAVLRNEALKREENKELKERGKKRGTDLELHGGAPHKQSVDDSIKDQHAKNLDISNWMN